MRLPAIKFSGRIMYSRTFDSVQKAAAELLQALDEKNREIVQFPFGFDIEWKPSFHKDDPPSKVAVMQICTDSSHCHVLHLIHSGIPPNLQLLQICHCYKLDFLFFFFCLRQLINYVSFNTKFGVRKVGVGIDSDATKVFRDYKISVKGVTDLSFHAKQKLGGDRNWGLSSLTEKLLSKQLKKPKKITLGNWETPVLSKEQLEYAATDAFASWYLYQAIKDLPDAQVTDKSRKVDGCVTKFRPWWRRRGRNRF
ncbi:Werner Syndrome-like exonuclease [Vigna unguiculata]|uniref:Werner Syndrome-like exonuclease n=1 Tax=Vigna unguiculata TaxID=3917 RepID=UPI001015F8AA|nr:Werner Syndrome-like exonuclease [Vigna unguiculata]XP_027927639.1 Werner Syndrome-like exonuclease [Vigna unguiculata]XP_027927641.1 Werner Syndrome-like exonuclease [Vigna unguiculata]